MVEGAVWPRLILTVLATLTLLACADSLNRGCAGKKKDCHGLCFDNDNPTVGCARPSCKPCTTVDNGIARCEDGGCETTCLAGYRLCPTAPAADAGSSVADAAATSPAANSDAAPNADDGSRCVVLGTATDCTDCNDLCPDLSRHVWKAKCIAITGCHIDECQEGYSDCNRDAGDGCEAAHVDGGSPCP